MFKKFYFSIVFIFLFLCCAQEGDKVTKHIDMNYVGKITIQDANENDLGIVLQAEEDKITLLSSKGYIYKINWNGSFSLDTVIYYSEVDCVGVAYISNSINSPIYGKIIFYGEYLNKIYIAKVIDTNNLAVVNSIPINIKSQDQIEVYNFDSVLNLSSEIIEISYLEVGIIPNIVPPLTIIYE